MQFLSAEFAEKVSKNLSKTMVKRVLKTALGDNPALLHCLDNRNSVVYRPTVEEMTVLCNIFGVVSNPTPKTQFVYNSEKSQYPLSLIAQYLRFDIKMELYDALMADNSIVFQQRVKAVNAFTQNFPNTPIHHSQGFFGKTNVLVDLPMLRTFVTQYCGQQLKVLLPTPQPIVVDKIAVVRQKKKDFERAVEDEVRRTRFTL